MKAADPVVRRLARLQQARERGGWPLVRRRLANRLRFAFMQALGHRQAEAELIADSAKYWNEGDVGAFDLANYSHWKGAGPWRDQQRWLRLGRVHHEMFERLCLVTGTPRPLRRILEWGCGGGANAIHFVDEAEEFCGIDISQASLAECRRVLEEAGFAGFKPVLIRADAPESAVELGGDGFDVFLTTYVFETLPSKAYVERVLATAQRMLRPDGLAIVQIRYDDGSRRSRQHYLDYWHHSTRFTAFRVEEFWLLAERVGFSPRYVTLVPRQTEDYSGDLYAYFALVKEAKK